MGKPENPNFSVGLHIPYLLSFPNHCSDRRYFQRGVPEKVLHGCGSRALRAKHVVLGHEDTKGSIERFVFLPKDFFQFPECPGNTAFRERAGTEKVCGIRKINMPSEPCYDLRKSHDIYRKDKANCSYRSPDRQLGVHCFWDRD